MTLDQTLQSAIAHHQANRLREAEPLYRQVLAQNPNHPTALHLLGVLAGQAGRPDIAEQLIRQAIAIHPREPYYYLNLGKFLVDLGKLPAAIEAYQTAVRLSPTLAEAHSHLGAALRLQGRHAEAVAAQREAIRLQPSSLDIRLNLANALHDAGHVQEAIAAWEEILRHDPKHVAALNNLGSAHKVQGRYEEAMTFYRKALEIDPACAPAHDNLGSSLAAVGRLEEAIASYRRAIAAQPQYAEAYNNLGTALKDAGYVEDAAIAYRQALAIKPQFPEACNNLGVAYLQLGKLDEAIAAFRQALALRPDYHDTLANLGSGYKDRAQLKEAEDCFRRVAALDPNDSDAQSNLLFTLHFDAAVSAQEILLEARRWNDRFAAPLASLQRPHTNDKTPTRQLKIAFTSPDFREHCQSMFTIPLLAHLDRSQFHITCYSDVVHPDSTTARIQKMVDVWRPIVGTSDRQVADLIRADGIDILIDLTMHMAHNRLKVFAQKPAPVQVTWLAYPGTTGLSAIDYRLSDPHLDPPEADLSVYAEKTIRLPETFWCYDPLSSEPLSDLPAAAGNRLTFASLNNYCKVNPAVLHLWASVLRAVPASRMLILTPEGSHRREIVATFEGAGVRADRIELFGRDSREGYLRRYHKIDIGLDTFPYNGHTTSLDAYWMGVPVVTLLPPESRVVGRAGLSQLLNLGMPDLIGRSDQEFVKIAATLAIDTLRLRDVRRTLRGKMEASPLMDGQRFAAAFGSALRQMWSAWCI